MVSCGISTSFPVLFPSKRKVAHALLTRPPLKHWPKPLSPLDLHVLGTPPAFVLSQDQTLAFNPLYLSGVSPARCKLIRNYCLLFALFLFCIVFKVQCPPLGLCLASKLVYIIIVPPKCQHLFATFLSFFHFFLHLRTSKTFSHLSLRYLPSICMFAQENVRHFAGLST